ncbi:sensor histidine kinase [Paenibacillus tarimensis]|uniref:sensor histidine kinase n=1 Tax=Paenibacillus tarimensis TaxID=416012 RepID=UPI001F39521E|nr:HAMP domain-containing sensor histidine kinase [Paenibacillus tarimensis]MCF2944791.1 HAMP domain-containing histidine kinase [Paenibacillus tarimensis]
MKANKTNGMMLRFIGQLILSVILSVVTVYSMQILGERVTRDIYFARSFALEVLRTFGEGFVILASCAFFFVMYLCLFQWRWYRYVNEINGSVMHIAEGNFDHKVPVKQNNPLGDLAFYTNRLVTQLRKSLDEERKAEQTKNELITNVSHDLRTPLTSILGYLGLVEQDRYRDEVELRYYIQIAHDKARRMNVLIQDLFEYTRMRHDSVPLRRLRFNLVEMLGQLLVHFRVTLDEAGVKGNLRAGAQHVYVFGDPDKLVRVFENLLHNAVTYGKDGGRVEVEIRTVLQEAVVEVINYGDPIPSVDLPHIFDRFYRVDKSRAEHTGGSGLGLAIAKSIVERHGGTIRASSDSAQTVFEVRLPLYNENQEQDH